MNILEILESEQGLNNNSILTSYNASKFLGKFERGLLGKIVNIFGKKSGRKLVNLYIHLHIRKL